MSDLVDMSNEEWLASLLALGDTEEALDYVYDSIDDAHGSPNRIDALLTWLDPALLSTSCILSVLSIARRPIAHLFPMAAAIGRGEAGPAPVSMPGLDAFARRAIAVVREREPAEDVPSLLGGLVDDAMLCGEVVRDGQADHGAASNAGLVPHTRGDAHRASDVAAVQGLRGSEASADPERGRGGRVRGPHGRSARQPRGAAVTRLVVTGSDDALSLPLDTAAGER